MGRHFVTTLLERGADVTLLNRGRVYWEEPNLFGDKVKRIIADRTDANFGKVLSESGEWDLVVDYCAYKEKHLKPLVESLNGKIKQYVFISTDSVYNVSKDPANPNEPRSEQDAVRPDTAEGVEKMKEKDSYGHHKLCCEEYLSKMHKELGFPFTAVRLPDVEGPYDNLDRHWLYQVWLKVHATHPVLVDIPLQTRRLSFVFSHDVTSAILAIYEAGAKAFGQFYNIGHEEKPTLVQYLESMAKYLGIEKPNIQIQDRKKEWFPEFLPSVDFGPITVEKALKELNWKPAPFETMMEITTKFFEEAWTKYPKLRPIGDYPKSMQKDIIKAYEQK